MSIKYDNGAELLPFIQLAHNTAYKAREETPHFLLFGRRASLPVDIIIGVLCASGSGIQLEYSRRTVENLQRAYEIACRKFQERADKQSESNERLFRNTSRGIQCLYTVPTLLLMHTAP